MTSGLGKSFLGAVAACSLCVPSLAGSEGLSSENESGFYLTLGAGISTASDNDWIYQSSKTRYSGDFDYSSGFSGEAGLGYDFGNFLRGELTYVRSTGELDSSVIDQAETLSGLGGYDTNSFMASAYIDIAKIGGLTPYFGAGVGISQITSQSGVIHDGEIAGGTESVFAYQAKVGASVDLYDSTDLFVEATYQGAPDVEISGVDYDHVGELGARVGLRFSF